MGSSILRNAGLPGRRRLNPRRSTQRILPRISSAFALVHLSINSSPVKMSYRRKKMGIHAGEGSPRRADYQGDHSGGRIASRRYSGIRPWMCTVVMTDGEFPRPGLQNCATMPFPLRPVRDQLQRFGDRRGNAVRKQRAKLIRTAHEAGLHLAQYGLDQP